MKAGETSSAIRTWRQEPDRTRVHPARRSSLAKEITEQLFELIISGAFPNDRLPPERVLCEQLGVSRGPLREALSTLTHLNVLETRGKAKYGRRHRARMHLMTQMPAASTEQELIEDPLEVRRMLEPQVAAIAAGRADEEAVGEIRYWCDLIDGGSDSAESTVEYDSAFHVAVAKATGNRTLVELVATLTDGLRASRELSFRPADALRRAQADHRAILNAIRAQDSVGAEKAMRLHLDHVERLIRSTLQL